MSGSTERDETMTLRIDPDGFIRLSWVPGLQISAELARAAMAGVDELNAGQQRPLFVDMTGTAVLTRGARLVFTEKCSARAIALVGRSAVDRVLANFALGVSAVPVPTRFFTSESAAVAWLRDSEHRN